MGRSALPAMHDARSALAPTGAPPVNSYRPGAGILPLRPVRRMASDDPLASRVMVKLAIPAELPPTTPNATPPDGLALTAVSTTASK